MRESRLLHASRTARGRGFTLIELMNTLVVFALVMVAVMTVVTNLAKNADATANAADARQKAAAAIEWITLDLRGAGSGVDAGYVTPQTAIAYIDSLELMLCGDLSGGVAGAVDTLAYAPGGSPDPFKLTGGYAPPIKYRTGAELIRWTLDINNDGAISAADRSATDGVDALRSRNPNDYTLVRQIYADSLGLVANDNGGAIERVAPILAPDGTVPPLYTVTFTDGTTWSWSSGAVPANRLKDIAYIKVQVTAESGRPDAKQRYARVTLSTTVSMGRAGS